MKTPAKNVLPLTNEEIFRAIFHASAEGVLIVDENGRILMANPSSEQLFGYSPGELTDLQLESLIPSRYRGAHTGLRQVFFKEPGTRKMGQGRELFALRKDGTEFSIEASLSHATLEGQTYVVAFITDITARKEQEKRLFNQQEQMRYFVEHIPNASAMMDSDLNYLVVSKKWLQDYNLEPENVLGRSHREVFPLYQPRWEKDYQHCLDGNIVRCPDDMLTRPDGTRCWLRWEAHPWRTDKGDIGGLILFTEDVTGRKMAEESLKRSQQKLREYTLQLERSNRELEDFAYVSSHDLQEPLRKIQAFGDRLRSKEGRQLSPQGLDYVERMLNSASRMQNLINDLLAFSRVTSKARPFTEVDLNVVLREVLSDLEVMIERNQAIVECGPLPVILADHTQIRQVFQNLISNAIKFKKPDFPPLVKVFQFYPAQADEDSSEFLYFKVTDNGIGFDEKYADRIFHIFQRLEGRKYEGSGIGLAICKKIVNRHGGEIQAHSQTGRGSEFTIKLPVQPEKYLKQ